MRPFHSRPGRAIATSGRQPPRRSGDLAATRTREATVRRWRRSHYRILNSAVLVQSEVNHERHEPPEMKILSTNPRIAFDALNGDRSFVLYQSPVGFSL